MGNKKKTIEFEFLGKYRATHHIGPEILEIEEQVIRKGFFGDNIYEWKRLYFGHTNPLEMALDFFRVSQNQEKDKT